jgi:hypothetical protein
MFETSPVKSPSQPITGKNKRPIPKITKAKRTGEWLKW